MQEEIVIEELEHAVTSSLNVMQKVLMMFSNKFNEYYVNDDFVYEDKDIDDLSILCNDAILKCEESLNLSALNN